MQYTFPIVGARFRPPAVPILGVLPSGTPLRVVAEPENEHDPNAVALWIDTEAIPQRCHRDLGEASPNFGFGLEDILATPEWHLGYIPRVSAENFAPLLCDYDASGVLGFDEKGRPTVKVTLEPK